MFKTSKLCAAIAVLGSALGATGAAYAAAYVNVGNLSISLDYYESGTLYGTPGGSGLQYICGSAGTGDAAGCDTAATSGGAPAYGSGTVSGFSTDTQGIFRINTITNTITSAVLYNSLFDSYLLTGIFSGLYDIQATFDTSTGQFNTRSDGGSVKIFSNTKNAANDLTNLAAGGTGVSGSKDLTNFVFSNNGGTISGGTLWLQADFSKSVIVAGDAPDATFQSTWSTGTSATGSSAGFLDINTAAGGAGLSWFATGTMQDAAGRAHDMYFSNSFNLQSVSSPQSNTVNDWDIRANTGQVVGNQAAPDRKSVV